VLAVLALAIIPAVAPPATTPAVGRANFFALTHGQKLTISAEASITDVTRGTYSATPGIQTLALNGTNFDWAKLVLLSGKWPTSTANVTVLTRWMRQENGPNNWWNRDNPLNNGYGSGGGGGTGSYVSLVIAAQKAAENLHTNPGFAAIAAAFARSAPTSVTEHAIWASPWSSSHYANGTHWSSAPVSVFTAPASAW
jgi:hypothetical protein